MLIKLKVRPNAGRQNIEKKNGFYLVELKSRPENNKANAELIKLLKKHFGKEVKIKSGFTSRNKIVEVIE